MLKYRLLRAGTDITAVPGQQVTTQASSSASTKAVNGTAAAARPSAIPAAATSSSSTLGQKKTLTVGPNSTIKAKDIIAVAQWDVPVTLDSVWLAKNETKEEVKEAPKPAAGGKKGGKAAPAIVSEVKRNPIAGDDVKRLSRVETRAVILLRLASSLTLPNVAIPLFLVCDT